MLTIIVPVYNEEKTLEKLLQKLLKLKLTCKTEIIVIDDGSTDSSKQILGKFKAKNKKILAVFHQKNRGKGAAIKTGLRLAKGESVIIQDADLEYEPKEIEQLLAAQRNQATAVYGSRNLKQNPKSSWIYFLGGVFLSKLTNFLYNQSLTDVSTCYKLFPKKVINEEKLPDDFSVCFAITAQLCKKETSIIEVPISYQPRSFQDGKKIKWQDGVVAILTLVKNRFS